MGLRTSFGVLIQGVLVPLDCVPNNFVLALLDALLVIDILVLFNGVLATLNVLFQEEGLNLCDDTLHLCRRGVALEVCGSSDREARLEYV